MTTQNVRDELEPVIEMLTEQAAATGIELQTDIHESGVTVTSPEVTDAGLRLWMDVNDVPIANNGSGEGVLIVPGGEVSTTQPDAVDDGPPCPQRVSYSLWNALRDVSKTTTEAHALDGDYPVMTARMMRDDLESAQQSIETAIQLLEEVETYHEGGGD